MSDTSIGGSRSSSAATAAIVTASPRLAASRGTGPETTMVMRSFVVIRAATAARPRQSHGQTAESQPTDRSITIVATRGGPLMGPPRSAVAATSTITLGAPDPLRSDRTPRTSTRTAPSFESGVRISVVAAGIAASTCSIRRLRPTPCHGGPACNVSRSNASVRSVRGGTSVESPDAAGSTNGDSPWAISKARSKPLALGASRQASRGGSSSRMAEESATRSPARPTAAPRTSGGCGANAGSATDSGAGVPESAASDASLAPFPAAAAAFGGGSGCRSRPNGAAPIGFRGEAGDSSATTVSGAAAL